MIPLSVLSVIRMYNSLLMLMTVDRNLVANAGLGKDIWTIPFDRITQILQVSNLQE